MNPIAAFSPARKTIARDDVADRTDDARESSTRNGAKQAEFSALLALLSGAGPRVRSEILKQLPAEGASIVDRLLDGAGTPAEGEVGADEQADGSSGPVGGGAHHGVGDGSAQSAADAMRYGQLKRTDDSALPPGQAAKDDDAQADGAGKGTSGLIGLSRALEHSHATDVLARIASKRGATVEQLRALGDERGADARAALDGILSRAGTAEGEQLASLSPEAAAAMSVDALVAGAHANAQALAHANAHATSALNAARARSAADVGTPVRDTDALVPEFRGRLERVIDRMKQEYGHDVSLVETARSQERQDHLFEQGRTRPGNIVTWTRDSAHTRGQAADLIVDGKWENAEGFARLQRIAREEGLRTLGVKDPGHVELPRDARHADAMLDGAARVSARIERASTQSSSAASPAVAPVAGVASVAGVARVADTSPTASTSATAHASMQSMLNRSSTDATGSNGNAFGRGERDENGRPMNEGRKLGHARDESGDSHVAPAFGHTTGPASHAHAAKVDAAAPVAGADAAQRVADLQDRRDATPGSISRLTLSMDGANGDDRITIDMRGKSVGTHISTDAASADGMRARVGELQDALGRHGLDADTVRISGTARTESAEGTRGAGAERDALKLAGAQQGAANDGTAGNGQRERAPGSREWEKQDDARRAREEQREQAREHGREHGRDARNGAGARGQGRNLNEGQR